MRNVIVLKCWEIASRREREQRKSWIVDSRLSGGNSLSPVLVKKGWVQLVVVQRMFKKHD